MRQKRVTRYNYGWRELGERLHNGEVVVEVDPDPAYFAVGNVVSTVPETEFLLVMRTQRRQSRSEYDDFLYWSPELLQGVTSYDRIDGGWNEYALYDLFAGHGTEMDRLEKDGWPAYAFTQGDEVKLIIAGRIHDEFGEK